MCTFGDDDEEMPQPSTNLVAPMQKEQSPCKLIVDVKLLKSYSQTCMRPGHGVLGRRNVRKRCLTFQSKAYFSLRPDRTMPGSFNVQYKASSRQQRASKLQPTRATAENLCSSLEMIASKASRDQHDFQYMLLKTENSRTRMELLNTQGSQEEFNTA